MLMMRLTVPLLIGMAMINLLYGQSGIEITLKQGSKPEAATREQLLRLLKTYDVTKWTFTKSVVIDEQAIPHSDPQPPPVRHLGRCGPGSAARPGPGGI